MDDSIRSFFDRRLNLRPPGNGEAPRSQEFEAEELRDRLHLAACTLLLELAYADDDFSEVERDHIEAVLRRHFGLDAPTARDLMALAEVERRSSQDIHPIAALIRSNYDLGQKTLLAEVMWGLVLADGRIAQREAEMLRKIAALLDLEPGYLSEPRTDAGRRS